MENYKGFKVGDSVRHRFRENKYQRCKIIEINENRLPLIKVLCEDGFYKSNEESELPYMDLTKI
jgi:hypothetical protein